MRPKARHETAAFVALRGQPAPASPTKSPPLSHGRALEGRLRVATLSAVAGFVDAAAFMTVLGLFPAHLTGEIVGAAVAVSSGHSPGGVTRLTMIPVFMAAVALAVVVGKVCRPRHGASVVPLLGLMTGALALFSLTDWLLPASSSHLAGILSGSAAVAAMGFQSTLMRDAFGKACPTTVMTGNLTQFVIEAIELGLTRKEQRPASDTQHGTRLGEVASALGAFSSGAVLGGWLTGHFGSLSALLPTLAIATLMVAAWREQRRLLLVRPPR
jgi:uncharacterized membrane protein YoaK (UPF0700 family)